MEDKIKELIDKYKKLNQRREQDRYKGTGLEQYTNNVYIVAIEKFIFELQALVLENENEKRNRKIDCKV